MWREGPWHLLCLRIYAFLSKNEQISSLTAMACQFKAYAKIDLVGLESQLNVTESGGRREDRFDDSSGSGASEVSFLNNCCASLSPGGEFLVFAHRRNLCILSAKWDSHEEDDVKTKFKTTWEGNPCHSPSEEITAVMCLPLIMPNKSSRSSHASELIDWTCIVAGFSSGHVRFYDEGGNLLLSEQIYDEPVTFLKCQSYHPAKNSSGNYDEYPEELYVTFRSTLAIIPGFALFQTLRACRNQLARVKANFAEHMAPPPLSLKKWSFVDQDRLRDCEVIGPSSSDMFDHLMTASIRGGFNAGYRSGAPKSTLVVAAGKGPFVGFHLAMEGVEGRSVLTDVAQAVKSKFKGFFFSSGNERQKTTATIEPPDNLALRFGICDFNREADHIVRSPNREYSAVTDKLGRITLVNNLRGIAVRMWKGYRNAQCGWLQVEEEEPSQKRNPKHLLRSVLFLVIYDPKRGMLEVWLIPNGVRIAAFSCSKKGRLLYSSHGLFGLNNVVVNWANRSILPCVFLDPKGTAFQIVVPFHCALSDATSERAADLALLRKLKSILREDDMEDEQLAQEVGLLAAELKTAEVRKQMLLVLTSNRHVTVDALEVALAVFMDRASSEDTRHQDSSSQSLLLSIQHLRNLLSFYTFVQQQKERPPNYTSVVSQKGISDLEAVSDVLSVSEREVAALKSLISLLDLPVSLHSTPRKEARVTFKESTATGSSLVNYLACFDLGNKSSSNVAPNTVAIKSLPPAKVNFLADLLFHGILYSNVPIEVWQAEAACSGIAPSSLLQLAIEFWLQRNAGKALEVEMIRFSEVIKAICLLEEVFRCDLSSFWSLVRSTLTNAPQPFNALTGALVCRAVACSLERQGLKKNSKSPKKARSNNQKMEDSETQGPSTGGESSDKIESSKGSLDWEYLSSDSVKWNLLIGRLEDIALLDQILSQNPANLCDLPSETALPCLNYQKPLVSLSTVLQKGKGAISEHVAKWLTTCGLDPHLLIDASDIEWMDKNAGVANSPTRMEVDEPDPEDKSEVTVREGVPLVTEKGTEASSVLSSHAQVLDRINLLRKHFPYSMCGSVLIANLSWEYLLDWHKSPERIDVLNAALACLQIIPNIHVQQGLAFIMWSSHLKQRFETVTRVINDSNGNPKEKLWHRELQMSECQLVEFTGTCAKFIDLFIEATNMCEVMHRPGPGAVVNRHEDIWDYEVQEFATNTPSLTALALMQPQASFAHLHLLYQLTAVTHMILVLGLHGQQTKQLFSPKDWSLFFSDNAHTSLTVSDEHTDPSLSSKRTQFLIRAVSGAMKNVFSLDPSHLNDLSGGLNSDMKTATQWIGKCLDLAYTWQLDVDPIRRHQVTLLYTSGHDRLAEEILPTVNHVDLMAQQLLMVCAQRVKLILNEPTGFEEKVANLDVHLYAFVNEMSTVGVRADVPVSDTALLACHVMKMLPESHPEHYLAEMLSEGLEELIK